MSAGRGRPRRNEPVVEVHVHLRLRVGEDDDLITFFTHSPYRQRVAALKIALRAGGMDTIVDGFDDPDESLAEALDDLLM